MKTLCLCGHARSQHNSPPTANGGRVCDYAGYACDCTGYHRIKPTGRSEAAIRPPLRDGEAQDTGTTSAERDDARAEIERLRTEVCRLKEALFDLTRERDELRQEKATDAWYTGWQEAVRRMQQAERERDELRALLREATAPSECAVCHAALLPTLEIPHCEDCIVTDDAAIDYEEASRDFVARLDAVLGGAK